MQKIKTILVGLVSLILGLGLMARTAYAFSPVIHITGLDTYTTTNDFTLTYTAIAQNPADLTNIQFYSNREGGGYIPFGSPFTGASGTIHVTNVEVPNDGYYCFQAFLGSTPSNIPCTTYDSTHPANPYNYHKSQVGSNTERIYWTNPSDSDFSAVFVYRGEQPDFSADDAHKITGVGGAPNADMSYDDSGLDPSKTYYYIIRAFDQAGNGSGLIGDNQVVTIPGTTVLGTTTGTTGKVTTLPKEKGEVLGETGTPTPTPTSQPGAVSQALKNVSTGRIIGWVIAGVLLIALGYIIFKRRRR